MIDEKWILVSFALLGCWQCTSGARILAFFPMPWRSHHFVIKPLMKELANRGHTVDYFTPLPMTNPPKGLRQLVVKDWQEEAMRDFDEEEFPTMSPFNVQRFMPLVCGEILEKTFNFDQVSIDLLKSNETYDLVLTEFAVGNEPAVYLAHKFKAHSVTIMGFPDYPWINELAGLPDNPSYMVSYLNPLTDSLTFSQRLYNTYVSASVVLSGYYDLFITQQPRADRIMRYEGWETRPKLLEMIGETALILTNSHPSTAFPYPKAPHVKEIAGMHLDPDSQPMPKELQDFMDDAPHGVIFFSLGSVLDPAQLLKDGKFDIFLNVFKKLKQKVMWKIAPGLPEVNDPKIKVQTWFPQQGILGEDGTLTDHEGTADLEAQSQMMGTSLLDERIEAGVLVTSPNQPGNGEVF